MPSNLRLQLDVHSTQSYFPQKTSPSPPPPASRMSLTQTYRVASTARGKLGMEAARPDHNLRLLVGHANLLDSLMLELATAEREQDAWFNTTVRNATKTESAPRHVQWFDSIAEEADYDDDSDSDVSSESDDDELEVENFTIPPRRRSVSPPPPMPTHDEDSDEELEDYDEDVAELALERVHSRTPDLVHEHEDSEDSSDDEAMPPSPPLPVIHFSNAKAGTATLDFAVLSNKSLLSPNATSPMISAY